MPSKKFLDALAQALQEPEEEVHPEVEELEDWLAGKCNQEDAGAIAAHVSGCEMCQAVLAEANDNAEEICFRTRSVVIVTDSSSLVATSQPDETYSARHLELGLVYDASSKEEALAGVITQALLYAEYVMELSPEQLSQVTARHQAYLEKHRGLEAWQADLRACAAANGLQLEGDGHGSPPEETKE